ncbi:MAG: thermonuclease family protein [Allosphingosinicella sp.]|uniref:thermonuclease family protein n=1 Tax=Allosphingosinicella sp. TaxID=2823234 RepID=UPI00393D9577
MASIPPFRRRGRRLQPNWRVYSSSRRRWREIRLMAEAGVLIGLSVFGLAQFASANLPAGSAASASVSEASAQATNPYAESERSRAILAAQEGGPQPTRLASTGRSTVASNASLRVIDGDTFDYGGERIRIADIDTPEVRGRCPEERAQAALATRRLRALLAAGPFELVRSGRDEDRYGRKLRIVVRDGRSIGDMLVAEGLARTWTGRREPWC